MNPCITKIHLDNPNSVCKQCHYEGLSVHLTAYSVLFWGGHNRNNHITVSA